MSGSLNLVQLIGNVGKDPELHHTQNGTPVCRLSVAMCLWTRTFPSEKKVPALCDEAG